MFSKQKISDTPSSTDAAKGPAQQPGPQKSGPSSDGPGSSGFQTKPKASPSLLSSDLTIKGNVVTSGDVQVEGTVEGDVRAHLLTVGEGATIKGEISADDVVVNGRVVGRLRGLKVRLTASAKVEGDIIHKTIAIESGAHFEGSVQRQEDPLGGAAKRPAATSAPTTPPAQSKSEPRAASTPASDVTAGNAATNKAKVN